MNTKLTRSMLVLLGALSVGSVARTAHACGGAWVPYLEENQVDYRVPGVARAEKTFDKGKINAAAASVIRMMPQVRDMNAKKSTLVARSQRILALAVARSDGALPIGRGIPKYIQGQWLGKTAKDKKANLAWAVKVLGTISKTKKNSPAAQTDLAEAMAHVDADKAQARSILEKLAKKDLVATPEGYAALASLRSESGDKSGGKLAMKRCQAMAGHPAACRIDAKG